MNALSPKDVAGIRLVAACAALLLAIGVVAAVLEARVGKSADAAVSCALGHAAGAHTTVLLDVTDPLTPVQREQVERRLRKLATADLSRGEHLELWVLGEPDVMLRRAFSRCYPGREANPLFENPRRVAARCESTFVQPMLEALSAIRMPGASQTPLLEAVQEVGSSPSFKRCAGRRRLLLVSDGLQHTDELSLYGGVPDLQHGVPAALHSDLDGVEVTVLQVSRGNRSLRSDAQVRGFLEAYFTACGASATGFSRL